MTKYFKFILLALTLLWGCKESKISAPAKPLDVNDLSSLVLKAINGDRKANDSLSGLIETELIENAAYNSLTVDSFSVDTLNFFYVLLEYPNQIFNRLAFYDDKTNCYLIDKSLNGKISVDVLEVQELKFLKVIESFLVKDTLEVIRLSFYKNIAQTIKLVYRNFAQLKTPKQTFIQTITSIAGDTIKTKLTVPKKVKITSEEDFFFYDGIENYYKSSNSLFDSLVIKEINNFEIETHKPNI